MMKAAIGHIPLITLKLAFFFTAVSLSCQAQLLDATFKGPLESMPEPDKILTLDFSQVTKDSYVIDGLVAGKDNTIKLSFPSTAMVPVEFEDNLEKLIRRRGTNTAISNGKGSYALTFTFFPPGRKDYIVRIEPELPRKSVKVILRVDEGEFNQEKAIRDLGFEDFVKKGMSSESFFKKFRSPKYVTMNHEGTYIVEYEFQWCLVSYSVLFEEDKVKSIVRRNMK